MKRIISLLLTLMMLCGAALADAPAYSPALAAEKLAIHAMYEQYDFTLETLGVFSIISAEKDGAWYVSFQTILLPYSRVGQYDAVVKGDDVTLTWTHDGTDVDHTTGDPECAVWCPAQIETYLATHYTERHIWIRPYFKVDRDHHNVYDEIWGTMGLTRIPEDDEKPVPDDLRAAANAAVMDVYGMTEEQFAYFERADRDMAIAPDGRTYFWLTYPGMDMFINVLVDAETNEVISIDLYSGGNG